MAPNPGRPQVDGADALQALFSDDGWSGSGGPAPRRRRGRSLKITAWILGILIVLLGGGYLVADSLARSTTESLAATAVRQALPDGADVGTITVHVRGGSAIAQYVRGSFDDVEIDVSRITVAGVTAPARIDAHGVPTSLNAHVGRLSIAMRLDQKALSALFGDRATVVAVNDGALVLDVSGSLNGVAFAASATTAPSVRNHELILTPTGVTITKAPSGVNKDTLAASLRAHPRTVCVTDRLPAALQLSRLTVAGGTATLTIVGSDVPLSAATLTTRGHC